MTDISLSGGSRAPWNRNDRTGFVISTVAPVLAVLAINALIFAAGWSENDAAYDAVSFNPTGWLVGAIWLVIYPMWGAARWYAYQTGLAGRRASFWILGLMLWGLLYPFITSGSNTFVSVACNVISLGLVLAAALRAHAVSKRAFWLIAPSIAWIGFATFLGFAALQHV